MESLEFPWVQKLAFKTSIGACIKSFLSTTINYLGKSQLLTQISQMN